MKDKFFDSSGNMITPSLGGGATGLSELRQGGGMSLGLALTSLRRYWYVSIIVGSLMMGVIAYKTSKQPRTYKSGIQIAIDLKSTSSFAEKLAASNNNNSNYDDRTVTIETITQILKSKAIIQKAVDTIPDSAIRPSADDVLGKMTIQAGQNTDILSVSYTDTNPQRIVVTLNALGKAYVDYSVKVKKTRTDKSIAFIESQLPESRRRLENSSQEVAQFRQTNRFFDPETSTKGLSEYRQEITAKLNENRVQYGQTQKQYAELKKQLASVGLKSNDTLSTTMLTQDSAYQELFKKLNELDLAYSQERVRFSDNNNIVITAKEKRDQVLVLLKNRAQQVLKRSVADSELTNGGIANFGNTLAQNLANKQIELENNLASQSAQYQSLSKVYERLELQVAQLPTLQKQYTELQRQYTIHSQELTAFLQKLQELKIADAEQVVPWSLLDPPELPTIPVSPDVGRQLGLGAFGSLLAGVLAAIGLNKLDQRIDNPEVIKAMTGMSILTLISKVDDFDRLAKGTGTFLQSAQKQHYSQWSFLESIRNLALGIGLTAGQQDNQVGKVIAMTSALPEEGKSTIAFHTSITLAELGYHVLLVDVDLHKSSIAKLCRNSALFQSEDCKSEDGLSDILLNGDKWDKIIKKSPYAKLDVLFAGTQSVNSILLLNSPDFSRLIEEWRREYDYVVFDTPCTVGVSDTRLIASLVDSLVFIVSLNVAKQQTIDRALDILSSIHTPILGLVVNRVGNQYSDHNKYHKYSRKNGSLPKM
jgi:polysaccharide biosynthesis transport protein